MTIDIFTIQKNLQNTISGKEAMLASLKVKDEVGHHAADIIVGKYE